MTFIRTQRTRLKRLILTSRIMRLRWRRKKINIKLRLWYIRRKLSILSTIIITSAKMWGQKLK